MMAIKLTATEIILQRLMGKGACRSKASHLKGSVGRLDKSSFLQHTGLVNNAPHNVFYGNRIILILQKAGHLSNDLSLTVFILHRHALRFFKGCHLHYQLQSLFQNLCQLAICLVYFLAN